MEPVTPDQGMEASHRHMNLGENNDVHQNFYNHQNFQQPQTHEEFNPANPLHASLWRYPRSGGVINVDPTELGRSREFWGNCCLGFLVDYRLFEADQVNDLIRRKWNTNGRITVFRMGDIYVFHCEDMDDLRGLLARTRASFDGALMVFTQWFPDTVPRTIRFPYAEIWVRVCGLPFECLNLHVAHVAGKILSHYYEVEPFEIIPRNDYLRLRVCINLSEPLMPGFFLAMDGGHLLWVQFKYEEVFKYCIRCGKVGHNRPQCGDSLMTAVSSIQRMLDRTVERGFMVFQAQSNHTMFNLDLRATPSTTRYITSRVRLGGRRIGNDGNGGDDRERMVLFYLGVTPGGRVVPGMAFAVTAQPFAGPVIFQVGPGAVHLGEAGGMVANGGNAPVREVVMEDENIQVQHNGDMQNDLGGGNDNEEEFHNAGEDFADPPNANRRDMELENLVAADPYILVGDPGNPRGALDRAMRLQEAVANRIEGDQDWARMADDYRGYNQTFDPPPGGIPIRYHFQEEPDHMEAEEERGFDGGGNHQSPSVVIVSSDSSSHFGNGDSQILEIETSNTVVLQNSGLVNDSGHLSDSSDDVFVDIETMETTAAAADIQDVNTELNLGLGKGQSSGSGSGPVWLKEAGLLQEVCITKAPPTIISKELELKGMPSVNFVYDHGETNREKPLLFYVPSFHMSSKLVGSMDDGVHVPSLSDSFLGMADCYRGHEKDTGLLEAVINGKKRKCCSDINDELVDEDEISSIGKAKSYLVHLAKKRYVGRKEMEMSQTDGNGGFRISVTDMDIEVLSESSQASIGNGFGEVEPNQPPRIP